MLFRSETIALLASGAEEIRSFSLTFSYLMQKPLHYLPAHLNVEEDVAPIKTFIQGTNCIVMKRHGITVLGRNVSECYHRTNVYAAEVKRQIVVELLCAAKGTKPEFLSREEMEWMFSRGDGVADAVVLGVDPAQVAAPLLLLLGRALAVQARARDDGASERADQFGEMVVAGGARDR